MTWGLEEEKEQADIEFTEQNADHEYKENAIDLDY